MQRSLIEQIPEAYANYSFKSAALREELVGLSLLRKYGYVKVGLNNQSINVPHPWDQEIHGAEVIAQNPYLHITSEEVFLEDGLRIAKWDINQIPIIRCVFRSGTKHKPKFRPIYITGVLKRNNVSSTRTSLAYPDLPARCLVICSIVDKTSGMIYKKITAFKNEMEQVRVAATHVTDPELAHALAI